MSIVHTAHSHLWRDVLFSNNGIFLCLILILPLFLSFSFCFFSFFLQIQILFLEMHKCLAIQSSTAPMDSLSCRAFLGPKLCKKVKRTTNNPLWFRNIFPHPSPLNYFFFSPSYYAFSSSSSSFALHIRAMCLD